MRRHYCKGIVVAAALFASEFALRDAFRELVLHARGE